MEVLVCNLDCLLDIMIYWLGLGFLLGVWVCSIDMLLFVFVNFGISWDSFWGVRVIVFLGSLVYVWNYGVYFIDF